MIGHRAAVVQHARADEGMCGCRASYQLSVDVQRPPVGILRFSYRCMIAHPRLAIVGLGKMGQTLRHLAPTRGWTIAAEIGADGNERGAAITRESLGGADVAIEFTTPESAPWNVRACARAGCRVVVGTTGWEAERPEVEREVLACDGAMLAAPNLSLGANVFLRIAEYAARLTARLPGFDAHILETHHSAKRDAPSGTALELARLAGAARGRNVAISSVRTGEVPGTHTLLIDGGFEQIHLEHVARDRLVFADGALTAAGWLIGRRGIFAMADLLMDEEKLNT